MIPTEGLKLTARLLLTVQRCGPGTMSAIRKAMIAQDGIEVSRDTFRGRWRHAIEKGWIVPTGEMRRVKHGGDRGVLVYALSPTCPNPLVMQPNKPGPKPRNTKRVLMYKITKPDTTTMTEAELIAAAVAEGNVRRFGPGTAEEHGVAKKKEGWRRASVLRGAKAGARAVAMAAMIRARARAGGLTN